MSILLRLFLNFAYIGAFSFGGGYAMMPLIQEVVVKNEWMSAARFADMIAISQMTPGPIAINMATFVGFQINSVVGSLVATIAVCAPSFIMVALLMKMMFHFSEHPYVKSVLMILRPVVTGLIAAAAFAVAVVSVIDIKAFELSGLVTDLFNPISVVLAGLIMVGIAKFKIHPILYIVVAGIIGGIWL